MGGWWFEVENSDCLWLSFSLALAKPNKIQRLRIMLKSREEWISFLNRRHGRGIMDIYFLSLKIRMFFIVVIFIVNLFYNLTNKMMNTKPQAQALTHCSNSKKSGDWSSTRESLSNSQFSCNHNQTWNITLAECLININFIWAYFKLENTQGKQQFH